MSRKGRLPIELPKGVEVKVADGEVTVKGPKGSVRRALLPCIDLKVENGAQGQSLTVGLTDRCEDMTNFQGLYRALIQNMVLGTTQGFVKELEMIGVGYRCAVQGNLLDIQIGLSHETKLVIPEGITVKVEKGTAITITGVNNQVVGQFAANVRAVRPPEPYQGKGIRYKGEFVRKKAGKAAGAKK